MSENIRDFLTSLGKIVPRCCYLRTHAHPRQFGDNLLDLMDEEEALRELQVVVTPTNNSHLLVAVLLPGGEVVWGVFTAQEYRESIARPGDGDRLPVFEHSFNRAELKILECLQMLSQEETDMVFADNREDGEGGGAALLAVDVGAAPGGWTGHLAALGTDKVGVISNKSNGYFGLGAWD